jgi:hypothetical protein
MKAKGYVTLKDRTAQGLCRLINEYSKKTQSIPQVYSFIEKGGYFYAFFYSEYEVKIDKPTDKKTVTIDTKELNRW